MVSFCCRSSQPTRTNKVGVYLKINSSCTCSHMQDSPSDLNVARATKDWGFWRDAITFIGPIFLGSMHTHPSKRKTNYGLRKLDPLATITMCTTENYFWIRVYTTLLRFSFLFDVTSAPGILLYRHFGVIFHSLGCPIIADSAESWADLDRRL